jgi:hypothetical protein
VRAKAEKDSDLTRWGSTVNKVQEGEAILLTRLSRSGNYVLAQPNSGRCVKSWSAAMSPWKTLPPLIP